jgi:hypothetical protein
MDRPSLIRGLRIAVSAVYGILCLLLVVLWVRSYHGEDRASGHVSSSLGVRFYSSRGWIVCSRNASVGAGQMYPWEIALGSEYWLDPDDDRLRYGVPNDFLSSAGFASVSIPHWILTLASGVAAATAVGWRCRFSLRTLLIATTLIAVLLATAACLRLW